MEIIKKIKELYKIPRFHALIKLGLYFLFFLIFGSIFAFSTSKNIVKDKNYDKYNFEIYIDDNKIEGIKNSDISFTYQDNKYIINNNKINCELDNCDIEFMYIFDLFTPQLLDSYIKDLNYEYQTKYSDGLEEIKYIINNENIKTYFNSDLPFELIIQRNEQTKYILNLENYNIFKKIIIIYI